MLRKKIAVITARADDGEQKKILSGIAKAAFSVNADVAVFSNIYNHWFTDELLNFENVIYDIFIPQLFDGIIITAEAFYDLSMLKNLFKKIKSAAVPTVIIGGTADGFSTVNSDDEADLEQVTNHLIDVHGLRNIDILTGFKNNPISHQRVAGCKKSFEKHGILFDEKKVFYGNFWTDSGEEHANRYINGEIPLPEAVICTNDYMAFGLCDALTAFGIKIPDQITVTGYDHTDGRIYYYPILTTYQRNRQQMGAEAVIILLSSNYRASKRQHRLFCGNTCACRVNSSQLNDEIREARIVQYHTVMNSVAQFASRLTLCRTLAEYTSVLGEFFYLLHDASALYLCLDKAWNSESYSGEEFLCCKIKEGSNSNTPMKFGKDVLLPELLREREKPMIFYFSPLYFQKRLFGYTALAYDYPQSYDLSFRDWNKTAANTLEFLRMKNDIHYLTRCRRDSALHDSLTGFYNLHEFGQIVETAGTENCFIQAVKMSFSTDGEYLYGENYRNDIISETALAIKGACKSHEICCRGGEDTFLILCTAEKGKIFSDKLKVMISHALWGKHNEKQVVISFAEYTGIADTTAINKLSENIMGTANNDTELLQRKKSLPHYKILSEIRSSIYASPKMAASIDELSRRLCVSAGYFRAIYKNCFGVSYVQDCINARVLLAAYLLCTTVMSIYAIAVKCGYSDEKYFARQFSQRMGCSPMHYRIKVS